MSESDNESVNGVFSGKKSTVYLGFIDGPFDGEKPTFEDTFVGGDPIWLHSDSEADEKMYTCCSEKMSLLCQAYAPLEDSPNDRVLYLFWCQKCNKQAKLVVGEKKNEVPEFELPQVEEKKIDFGALASGNPFSGGSNPFSSDANPFSQSASPFGAPAAEPEPKPKAAAPAPAPATPRDYTPSKGSLPGFFLYTDQESFKKQSSDFELPKNLKIDPTVMETDFEMPSKPVNVDPRTERLSKVLDDDVFQQFQEVVSYNTAQVLRYELGGQPLLYTGGKLDTPKGKQFEMQMMPKVIMDLEEEITEYGQGMEWGTIMCFTGESSTEFDCHGVRYVQESVLIQWEPK